MAASGRSRHITALYFLLPLHVSRPLSLTGPPCPSLCSVHLSMAPYEFQRCASFTSDFPTKYYIILVVSYTDNMSFQEGDHSENVVSSCVVYSNLEKKKVVLINEVIYTKSFKKFFQYSGRYFSVLSDLPEVCLNLCIKHFVCSCLLCLSHMYVFSVLFYSELSIGRRGSAIIFKLYTNIK